MNPKPLEFDDSNLLLQAGEEAVAALEFYSIFKSWASAEISSTQTLIYDSKSAAVNLSNIFHFEVNYIHI